jgi:Flp pilus assembly CpaF family ATPase
MTVRPEIDTPHKPRAVHDGSGSYGVTHAAGSDTGREVRSEEALDLLMAWNLGTPGGFATVHANDARSSLTRIETLVSMHPHAPRDIPRLIGEVQPILVHIARTKNSRIVREIVDVQGYGKDGYLCME